MTTNQPDRLYLSPPHLSGLEEEFVREAFASNWIAPVGPQLNAFEQEVAAYIGVKSALGVISGTAALHLALRLVGVGHGDIVFCSSLTFIASINPILYQSAIPVFIDAEPETWNMSPLALKKAFIDAEKDGIMPKAVLVVDIYGQSADMIPILEICNQYGVPVIEDAAEAMGANYMGKACGSWGKYGAISFNGNKIITTSGGGMLVTDDENARQKAFFWSTQACDRAPWYQHTEMGFNYRMSNIIAAIGLGQLRVLEERVEARRAVFERYQQGLGDLPGVGFMPESPNGRCNRWLTVMTLNPDLTPVKPMQVADAMDAEGIAFRLVFKPMHLQPLFAACKYFTHTDNESISDQIFDAGICLPSGTNMTEDDQNRVIECVVRRLSI